MPTDVKANTISICSVHFLAEYSVEALQVCCKLCKLLYKFLQDVTDYFSGPDGTVNCVSVWLKS